jgi:hypothetical protein
VAFVRTKRVGDHEYRQLVENYRENGHHRQRVLAHLGEHATVEDAIAGTRQKLADLDASRLAEQVEEAEQEVAEWERIIRGHYGGLLARYHDGEIPTSAEVKKRTGTDKLAPKTDEVLREYGPKYGLPGFTVYKPAVVPIPPEVDEYCRAFGDGTAEERENPNVYGRTVYYPGLYDYERRIDRLRYWRERAEEKRTEYERRRQHHLDRIEKLEQVAHSLRGD